MKILVIEDERALAEAIRVGLQEENMTVDYALDGNEGLFKARKGAYDAIVLDLMLPGKNGYEICQALRKARIWTPILMLTARQGEANETRALDIGADDFLTKPFSYRVLVARLRALVRRGTNTQAEVLRVQDLELNLFMRSCTRASVPIELTSREFTFSTVPPKTKHCCTSPVIRRTPTKCCLTFRVKGIPVPSQRTSRALPRRS
jgi:DNA-binding response OmpR family regulator